MTDTVDISGVLGGKNSQLGRILPGYDPDDYQAVKWIRNSSPDSNIEEQDYGTDEGGHRVLLLRGCTSTLQRPQVAQAVASGAILTLGARWGSKVMVPLYEVIPVSDSASATVFRAINDPIAVSDSASRSIQGFARHASDSVAITETALRTIPAQVGTRTAQVGAHYLQPGQK